MPDNITTAVYTAAQLSDAMHSGVEYTTELKLELQIKSTPDQY